MIVEARKTNHTKGRASDDKISFVENILMAVSNDVHNDDDAAISNTTEAPTKKKRLELLGIKQSTGYVMFKKQEVRRKELLSGGEGDWSRRKSRKGFWKKVSDELRQKIVQWIRNHNQVVHSPNARDTIQVKDEEGNIVRKHKLILQCTVAELLTDLYKEHTGLGPILYDDDDNTDGKTLVSETLMYALLPPELRFISNRYKQQCCCEYCVQIEYFQNALNRFRHDFLKSKKKEVRNMPSHGRQQQLLQKDANRKVKRYQQQAFGIGNDINNPPALHPKPRHAVMACQCDPPPGFEDENLCKIDCAMSKCEECPDYPRPDMEIELEQGDQKIYFYHYESLPTCSRCGPLEKGSTECPHCARETKKPGSFGTRKHLVIKHESFPVFWEQYYYPYLKKYQKHYWKMIVLSKRFVNDLREAAILNEHDIVITHDFTDAMCLTHNMETQSNSFGGNSSHKVGIEGYTVCYCAHYDYAIKLVDFHSFLSDSSIQEARTVMFHMEKLMNRLRENGKVKEGSRVLCVTDGCAKQYRSATSLYFLSALSSKLDLIFDRAVCCVGHGKSIVDAINGNDKNVILKCSQKFVQDAADAGKGEGKALIVAAFDDQKKERVSAADNCADYLIKNYHEVEIKRRGKRKNARSLQSRFWTVRPLDAVLNQSKYKTITFDRIEGVTFSDMYHFYTCKELGVGMVALRRVPCYCVNCNKQIQLPWEDGVTAINQQRFKSIDDCFFASVVGNQNKWRIAKIEEKPPGQSVIEDGDALRHGILRNITAAVALEVEEGNYGAVSTDDEDAPFGYYLLKFTCTPYTDQNSGALMVKGKYWIQVPVHTQPWFTGDDTLADEVVQLSMVVSANVDMLPISATNMPPRNIATACRGKAALKVATESHAFICDEIVRREHIEYDPTRVYAEEEEEYSDSDSDDDDDGDDAENLSDEENETENEEGEMSDDDDDDDDDISID